MKWFFAVTEATLSHADHDFPGLMKAAVASARMNTTLEPNLVYDGAEIPLTEELHRMGVNIIHHQLSMGPLFRQRATPEYPLAIALGAYLRTDIPDIDRTDDLVLYTDCDVLFLKDPKPPVPAPTYFACAPERHVEDMNHINTGVMWMNLPNLRQDLPVFKHYIQENFLTLSAFDQGAYNNFYMGRWDRLSITSNWKPYWTINPEAEILHFHGPKPMAAKKRMADPEYRKGDTWGELLEGKDVEYRHYVAQWDFYRAKAEEYIGGSRREGGGMSDVVDLDWIGRTLREVQSEQRSLRTEQGILRQQLSDGIAALLDRIRQSEALMATRFDLLMQRMDQTPPA